MGMILIKENKSLYVEFYALHRPRLKPKGAGIETQNKRIADENLMRKMDLERFPAWTCQSQGVNFR